jgi:hypothetical protein
LHIGDRPGAKPVHLPGFGIRTALSVVVVDEPWIARRRLGGRPTGPRSVVVVVVVGPGCLPLFVFVCVFVSTFCRGFESLAVKHTVWPLISPHFPGGHVVCGLPVVAFG